MQPPESAPAGDPAAASTPAPAPAPAEPEPRAAGGGLLRGTPVAPGLVLGHAHRKDYDLSAKTARRVALDQVEHELNRFRAALDESRRQLVDLKGRLEGKVRADDARVLDTHLMYLKDSVFIADVENLILAEQMNLEAAIAKVIADFDRIFRLVESETLRQSAIDLRDVGIRVLRNLEGQAGPQPSPDKPKQYVLIARELSIVDMFNLANECVLGIATEEGGLTSHAAIFARSMRIPTLTSVEGLLTSVQEGDFLILDAAEGVLRVNPDEVVRAQYAAPREAQPAPAERPSWAKLPARTRDGASVHVAAACGNLPEVEQSSALGLEGIGLYRTELLYLVDKEPPSRDALAKHYRAVVEGARGQSVTFRLLNADSGLCVGFLHDAREPNPALGRFGVRLLLHRELVLRRQLQAILLAGDGANVRIAVPGVSDCSELRQIKECLFDERLELRKAGERFQERVELGAVLETPAALLGARDVLRECDFAVVNLDALLQYLLAADRDNPDMAEWLESIHPFALRAIAALIKESADAGRPLMFFGQSLTQPGNLALLHGIGARHYGLPPSSAKAFLAELRALDGKAAARAAKLAANASCLAEMNSLVSGYRHGFART